MKNYLYAVMFFYFVTISVRAEDELITLDLKEGVVFESLIVKRNELHESYYNFKLKLSPYFEHGICFRDFIELEMVGVDFHVDYRKSAFLGRELSSVDCEEQRDFVTIENMVNRQDFEVINGFLDGFEKSCKSLGLNVFSNGVNINEICNNTEVVKISSKSYRNQTEYEVIRSNIKNRKSYVQVFKTDGSYELYKIIH
ncbi:hypothetical protein K0I63_18895 [Shewanella rhizosphaerae]|uniref:hypothetical protein n=1 Tax=Shewanella rhizosphaerae TaxID=2864207 RepID=UPI001C65E2F1|nr:hypothetical protein [Shewanella rhizosphaerae]QYK12764.1 hypothetical protein K0I63_18895 [Shewanella rhizosphaerae]